MANSIASYSDSQIMKCLLTRDFSEIGSRFEDSLITKIKAAAFYEAQNLTEVVAPAVTQVGSFAFSGTSLTMLSLTWDEITSIGAAAFGNGGFEILPQDLVLTKLTALGNGAFAGTSASKNTQIRTVSLPVWTGSSVSEEYRSVSNGIFEHCSALRSVSAPELQAIPASAFRYCTALTELSFPKASSIGSNAFNGCTGLTKLDIGGAVTSLSSAFLPTGTTFQTLILRGLTSVPTLGSSTMTNTSIASGTGYVYVPSSILAAMKLATNWSNYASQLRAIEDYPEICG